MQFQEATITESEVNVALLLMQNRSLQQDLAGMVTSKQELEKKVADLEQKVKNAESTKTTWYQTAQEKDKLIDECHSFIDGLPYGPERTTEKKDRYGSTNQVELSLITRLALSLALKV